MPLRTAAVLAFVAALLQAPAGGPPARRFGVHVGGVPEAGQVVRALQQLDSSWARVNDHLDGHSPDLTAYLRSGIDLVVTFNNADPQNSDSTYGSPSRFPGAGFPFRSRERYQTRVREALAPALPFLRRGRQVWAQCENEIMDAKLNPRSRFWRGTLDQYAAQLEAFAAAVHAVDPSIPVVLTSVASRTLDALIEPSNPGHADATRFVTRLLSSPRYDAVDLHFYGCVEDIPAKVAWVQSHLPAGRRWISTENGGPDDRCRTTPHAYADDPSRFEQAQARQVPARLAACADRGGAVCLWFSLFDLRGEETAFAHLGLVDIAGAARGPARGRGSIGRGDARRKAAFDSFREFVAAHREP